MHGWMIMNAKLNNNILRYYFIVYLLLSWYLDQILMKSDSNLICLEFISMGLFHLMNHEWTLFSFTLLQSNKYVATSIFKHILMAKFSIWFNNKLQIMFVWLQNIFGNNFRWIFTSTKVKWNGRINVHHKMKSKASSYSILYSHEIVKPLATTRCRAS